MPMPSAATHNELLPLKDAAGLVPCSVRTLRRRIAEGKLPAYRSGQLIRVKRADLDAMLQPVNPWAAVK